MTRLKLIRKNLGLTQAEFATKIGITQSSYSDIESGKSALTDRNIMLVCLALGVSETWLRTGMGEMFATDKEYTNDEQEILAIFRRLPPESRDAFLLVGQGLLLKNQQAILEKTSRETTAETSQGTENGEAFSEAESDLTAKKRA
jgi:transcriptional regulator with XRE-family HTH domain